MNEYQGCRCGFELVEGGEDRLAFCFLCRINNRKASKDTAEIRRLVRLWAEVWEFANGPNYACEGSDGMQDVGLLLGSLDHAIAAEAHYLFGAADAQ